MVIDLAHKDAQSRSAASSMSAHCHRELILIQPHICRKVNSLRTDTVLTAKGLLGAAAPATQLEGDGPGCSARLCMPRSWQIPTAVLVTVCIFCYMWLTCRYLGRGLLHVQQLPYTSYRCVCCNPLRHGYSRRHDCLCLCICMKAAKQQVVSRAVCDHGRSCESLSHACKRACILWPACCEMGVPSNG